MPETFLIAKDTFYERLVSSCACFTKRTYLLFIFGGHTRFSWYYVACIAFLTAVLFGINRFVGFYWFFVFLFCIEKLLPLSLLLFLIGKGTCDRQRP